MAIEDGFLSGGEHGRPDVVPSDLSAVLVRVAVVVTAVGWVVFWGIVARLHLTMGDYLSAGFTAVAFILTAMVGLGYYLRESLTRD